MEIISIDKKTFEEMVSRFDELVTRAGALCPKDDDKKMSGWMDSQDVCILLNISPRTLQTLRDNGRLAYSQITTRHIISRKMLNVSLRLWKRKKSQ